MPDKRDSLRVLPCTDSYAHAHRFSGLKGAAGIDVLPLALVPLLLLRAQRDDPDVIVIATERFQGPTWSSESQLREALSSVPAILLIPAVDSASVRRARRLDIHSVLPWDVSAAQLIAAVFAAEAGLAVSLAAADGEGEDREGQGSEGQDREGEDRDDKGELYAQSYLDAAGDRDTLTGADLPGHLTPRELEVLRLMALGRGNKQIAAQLGISEHTAKFHVSQVLGKLGASSRTEAVSLGITHGLVAI